MWHTLNTAPSEIFEDPYEELLEEARKRLSKEFLDNIEAALRVLKEGFTMIFNQFPEEPLQGKLAKAYMAAFLDVVEDLHREKALKNEQTFVKTLLAFQSLIEWLPEATEDTKKKLHYVSKFTLIQHYNQP